eukprot:TRINITY_DN1335_c0_g1_i1.p1 TRINITY_DN1335_c0_g1~~TRINITY_DN1335_c0_g1_i1.p1  ORF type:complete len:126 (+),score=46.27 TRINITY_DN1335_c0_g1_i1:116-493(+)
MSKIEIPSDLNKLKVENGNQPEKITHYPTVDNLDNYQQNKIYPVPSKITLQLASQSILKGFFVIFLCGFGFRFFAPRRIKNISMTFGFTAGVLPAIVYTISDSLIVKPPLLIQQDPIITTAFNQD